MQFSAKLNCIILLVGLLISCTNTSSLFSDVKKINEENINSYQENGFIGIKNEFYFEGNRYLRFMYIQDKKAVIDGYWHRTSGDTLLFIPIHSFNNRCYDKLTFFIADKSTSYWLGRSCKLENNFYLSNDVLIENSGTNSNMKDKNFIHFKHIVFDQGYYEYPSDPMVITRYYSLNFRKGIKIDSTIYRNNWYDYWLNY
jgi:hypothetical protein